MFILFILSLLGYCLLSHKLLRIELQFTPFFTVTSIIVFLYGAAYLGSLEYGPNLLPIAFNKSITPQIPLLLYATRFLFFGGLMSLFVWAVLHRNNISSVKRQLFDPVIVLFFFLSFFLFFVTYGKVYYWTDEGAHWGYALKVMLFCDSFPATDRYLCPYTHYPPASTLFHYYASRLVSQTEGTAIFANALLLLACILTGSFGKGRRRYVYTGILLFINYILLHQFSIGPVTTTADAPMALLFGASLIVYFRPGKFGRGKTGRLFTIAPALLALTLVKPTGILFATSLVLVVLADRLFFLATRFCSLFLLKTGKEESGQIRREIFWTDIRKKIVLSFVWIFLLAVPFISYGSWSVRSKALELSGRKLSPDYIGRELKSTVGKMSSSSPVYYWPLAVCSSEARKKIFADLTPEQSSALRTFAIAFRTAQLCSSNNYLIFNIYSFSFCPAEMALVLLFILPLLFVASPVCRTERPRFCLMIFLLLCGFMTYLACLFFVYLFTFSTITPGLFHSYSRYAGSYCHGLWMFYTALSGYFFDKERIRHVFVQIFRKTNFRPAFYSWLAFLLLPLAFLVHVGVPYFFYYDCVYRLSYSRKDSLEITEKVAGRIETSATLRIYAPLSFEACNYLPLDLFPADVRCNSIEDGRPFFYWDQENPLRPREDDYILLIGPFETSEKTYFEKTSFQLILDAPDLQLWKKNKPKT